MKTRLPERRSSMIDTPLQFKRLKEEGQGAYSTVQQVIDPRTLATYALKTVDRHMT